MIEEQIVKLFGSKVEFCRKTGKSDNERKNLKKSISSIYKKVGEINNQLKELGIEVILRLKK